MVQLSTRVLGSPRVEELRSGLPCVVGRSPSCSLRIESRGIWPEHFRLESNAAGEVVLYSGPGITLVNGHPVTEAVLRSGDTVEFGDVSARFWLAPAPQGSLRPLELLVWLLVLAAAFVQILIIRLLS